MNTPKNFWSQSFVVFERNGVGRHDCGAEHDVLYVHAPGILWDSADGAILRSLGWNKNEDRDGEFEDDNGTQLPPDDEDSSWYLYV